MGGTLKLWSSCTPSFFPPSLFSLVSVNKVLPPISSHKERLGKLDPQTLFLSGFDAFLIARPFLSPFFFKKWVINHVTQVESGCLFPKASAPAAMRITSNFVKLLNLILLSESFPLQRRPHFNMSVISHTLRLIVIYFQQQNFYGLLQATSSLCLIQFPLWTTGSKFSIIRS